MSKTPEIPDLRSMTIKERHDYMRTPDGVYLFDALLGKGISLRAIYETYLLVPYIKLPELRITHPALAEVIEQHKNRLNKSYEAVRTPEGLAKFRFLLAQNVPLKIICEEHFDLPFRSRGRIIRRLPELAQEIENQKLNDQHLKYRLILGIDVWKRKGIIALTTDTPEELWQSSFIRSYFKSYKLDPDDYKADYLRDLHHKGVHQLSNLYAIAHCKISYAGGLQIVRPKLPNDPE